MFIHLQNFNYSTCFVIMDLEVTFPMLCSVLCSVIQLCLTPCNPMDCSSSGSSVHGILRVRILEWVAMPSSRGSSQPRDRACISCIAAGFFFVEPCENPSKSFSMKVKIKVVQSCLTLYDPKEFSRLEYWSGLPCPSLGDLPNPGIEPGSPELQGGSLPSEPLGIFYQIKKKF